MNLERICNVLRNDEPIRQKLNSLIDKGIKENKEYGLNICLNEKASMTDTCRGTECEIRLTKDCSLDTKEVVGFHVHHRPHDYERLPSGRDYLTTARLKEKHLCIGYKVLNMNMVNCYKVPEDIRQLVEDFEITYNEYFSIKEKYPEDKKKLLENWKKLSNTFNKIKRIEDIDINKALNYAGRNKLCDIVVSFKPKVHKKIK